MVKELPSTFYQKQILPILQEKELANQFQELQFTQDYAKWVLEDQRWRESLLELESRRNTMETDVFSIMKYLIMQF